MGDPVTMTMLIAGSSIAKGVAGYSEAQGQKQQAESNAYIARTRAIQTNVSASQNLNSELATLRATFAANDQQPGVGTDTIAQAVRQAAGRDSRIAYGNDMNQAADYSMQAKNDQLAGVSSLIGGISGAAPSLYDLYKQGN